MFNWKRLCSNENSFEELHDELKAGNGLYILDNVKMPETCGDCVCTIEFKYYSENRIVLSCSGAPVDYLGTDTQIAEWLTTGTKEFGNFDEVKTFLSKFKSDRCLNSEDDIIPVSVVENGTSAEVAKPRPKVKYDKDNLTVPESNKKYIVIDKDKLILELNDEIFGQEENIAKIAHLVCNHLATKHKSRPLSVFIYGPTGIGKSAVIEALVAAINRQIDKDKAFAYRPVDCTQFQDRADISRLTGAAPGYVGFDEPGVFAILEDNPNTVFVFEEIEKAANNATEVIMQAMETGKQETNGKTLKSGENYYDLSNCIIFFTSNIEINEKKNIGFAFPVNHDRKDAQAKAICSTNIARIIGKETKEAKVKLAGTGKFRREVIGRMNAIIKFNAITGDAIKDVAAKCISNLAEKDHYLYVTEIETGVLQEFLNVTAGEVENFGVRAVRDEAQYYFSDALRVYSHTHADYAHIKITGTLDNVVIVESE
ncbi:MAG: ATP-dependent Clp protease ATP-binding subunit [Clostridia bacterium]|nr:ATP-dependent Clp protease ATP-binding subunit [Clostridia bacterium]